VQFVLEAVQGNETLCSSSHGVPDNTKSQCIGSAADCGLNSAQIDVWRPRAEAAQVPDAGRAMPNHKEIHAFQRFGDLVLQQPRFPSTGKALPPFKYVAILVEICADCRAQQNGELESGILGAGFVLGAGTVAGKRGELVAGSSSGELSAEPSRGVVADPGGRLANGQVAGSGSERARCA